MDKEYIFIRNPTVPPLCAKNCVFQRLPKPCRCDTIPHQGLVRINRGILLDTCDKYDLNYPSLNPTNEEMIFVGSSHVGKASFVHRLPMSLDLAPSEFGVGKADEKTTSTSTQSKPPTEHYVDLGAEISPSILQVKDQWLRPGLVIAEKDDDFKVMEICENENEAEGVLKSGKLMTLTEASEVLEAEIQILEVREKYCQKCLKEIDKKKKHFDAEERKFRKVQFEADTTQREFEQIKRDNKEEERILQKQRHQILKREQHLEIMKVVIQKEKASSVRTQEYQKQRDELKAAKEEYRSRLNEYKISHTEIQNCRDIIEDAKESLSHDKRLIDDEKSTLLKKMTDFQIQLNSVRERLDFCNRKKDQAEMILAKRSKNLFHLFL